MITGLMFGLVRYVTRPSLKQLQLKLEQFSFRLRDEYPVKTV